MLQEFSSGGIIIKRVNNNWLALTIKDSYDNHSFPKGHIESNESIEEAARREIQEEVGITDLKFIADLGVNEHYFTDKFSGNKIHKFVHYFLFETSPETEAKVNGEEGISNPKWIKVEKLSDTIGYENLKKITKNAQNIIQDLNV